MNAPEGMPRLAQDMTSAQIEECIAWFATLPLKDLRQRQSIHGEQAELAAAKGYDAVAYSEQIKFDMVTDAISRKTTGDPMGGLHFEVGAA